MQRLHLILILGIICTSKGNDDPCLSYEYLHNSEYRGENCSMSHQPVCDYHIQKGWYRIRGDVEILTHAPGLQKCATLYTIWMNGTLPAVTDDIVNRTACQTGLFSHCESKIEIRVKNCAGFYVYDLHYPLIPTCDSAFCFGPNKDCPPEEPCDFYYHKNLPNEDSRQLACQHQPGNGVSDSTLVQGWYKLSKRKQIANVCPGSKTCGTEKAVWINGEIPSNTDAERNLTACVANASSCCGETYNTKMKNCTDYLVYYLNPTRFSSERYCLGDGVSVECPTTTLPSTEESTSKPNNISNSSCFGMCNDDKILMISLTVTLVVVVAFASGILLFSHIIRKPRIIESTSTSFAENLKIKKT